MVVGGDGGFGLPEAGACEVEVTRELRCHRCAGELICSARVPHSFLRADGVEVPGFREVGLCAECDQGRIGAAGLVEHFRRHGAVSPEHLPRLAGLLREWLAEIGPATVDPDESAWLPQR